MVIIFFNFCNLINTHSRASINFDTIASTSFMNSIFTSPIPSVKGSNVFSISIETLIDSTSFIQCLRVVFPFFNSLIYFSCSNPSFVIAFALEIMACFLQTLLMGAVLITWLICRKAFGLKFLDMPTIW